MFTPMCLCFLMRRNPDNTVWVLLGRKKLGFGTGQIVGLGGHVEPGESARDAAVREAREEAGVQLVAGELRAAGQVLFQFPAKPKWNQRVELFIAWQWSGEIAESDEIEPVWHTVSMLPFTQMWDDARFWLPQVLRGETVDAKFEFAPDNALVSRATVRLDAASLGAPELET